MVKITLRKDINLRSTAILLGTPTLMQISNGSGLVQLGMQAWSRWPAEVQAEHQNREEKWFKWIWHREPPCV